MKQFTHEAMRENSRWTAAERELMAAFIQKLNELSFCIGAHSAVFVFNVTNCLADAFGFAVPDAKAFEAEAKYLLKHGYK